MMNQYLVENLQSYTTFYFRLAKGNSAGLSNYSIVSHYKTAGILFGAGGAKCAGDTAGAEVGCEGRLKLGKLRRVRSAEGRGCGG